MSGKLESSIEQNTLCALIYGAAPDDLDLAKEVAARVQPDLFSTKDYQRIARLAFNWLEEHGEPLGIHIYDELEDVIRRSTSEAKLTKVILNQMEQLRRDLKRTYVLSMLDGFIAHRRVQIAIDDASEASQNGDDDKARELMLEGAKPPKPRLIQRTTAATLMATTFPPVQWLIPNFVPQGLTVIAGPPKLGKSWLDLNIALGCVCGIPVLGDGIAKTEVLLCDFENRGPALQKRLKYILGSDPSPTELSHLDLKQDPAEVGRGKAFVAYLNQYLDQYPNIGLVIIDPLRFIRDQQRRWQSGYDYDTETMDLLMSVVADRHVNIVVVHHTIKARGGDPFEMLYGTQGLTGSADTIIVMQREGKADSDDAADQDNTEGTPRIRYKKARFVGTGRSLPEDFDKLIELDPRTAMWDVMGDTSRASPEQQNSTRDRILSVMRKHNSIMRPSAIAAELHIDRNVIDTQLRRLKDAGKAESPKWGMWRIVRNPGAHDP
jgi:hypothetical protein